MSKDKDVTGAISFPEKWFKVIEKMPEFKEAAEAASVEDLKKIIVTCEGNLHDLSKEEAANTKLSSAKAIAKDESLPYREGRKAQNAKIQYALFLLEGKGVDLSNKD
jgi:hypothetical protein